jgi:hypothetical protein
LQKRSEKHRESFTSYDNAPVLIQESGNKQKEALSQMIDASELAEKTSAQMRKQYLNLMKMDALEFKRLLFVQKQNLISFSLSMQKKQNILLVHLVRLSNTESLHSMMNKSDRPPLTIDALVADKTEIEQICPKNCVVTINSYYKIQYQQNRKVF